MVCGVPAQASALSPCGGPSVPSLASAKTEERRATKTAGLTRAEAYEAGDRSVAQSRFGVLALSADEAGIHAPASRNRLRAGLAVFLITMQI